MVNTGWGFGGLDRGNSSGEKGFTDVSKKDGRVATHEEVCVSGHGYGFRRERWHFERVLGRFWGVEGLFADGTLLLRVGDYGQHSWS